MTAKKSSSRVDPEGARLPIKLDSTSNGEFIPKPLTPVARDANVAAFEHVTQVARRLGISRRSLLISSAGAAATLSAMNNVFAAAGKVGGSYVLPKEASYETAAAATVVDGGEFIFDVQLHHVNPNGEWREKNPAFAEAIMSFPQAARCQSDNPFDCVSGDALIKEVFLDSDTDMAVLSMGPSAPYNQLTEEEAAVTRATVDALEGDARLMIHGLCHPNFPGHLQRMDAIQAEFDLAGWKAYTQWGPEGVGFFLDDEDTGIPMIETARAHGVQNICVHKGLPLFDLTHEHSTCRDVGVVAGRYPDMNFLIYHSGYDDAQQEGPYDPQRDFGINNLINSLHDNGFETGSNVYAELGSTWRILMADPDQAAHMLGKLLKFVGEDNILWGTDAIWFGSPQDQIQAFRAFEISTEFQERYGYPALTPERKAKIFGLNAARVYGIDPSEVRKRASSDPFGKIKQAYSREQDPSFLTYGPKTEDEFRALLKANGGWPG